jgi:hypothetical protein
VSPRHPPALGQPGPVSAPGGGLLLVSGLPCGQSSVLVSSWEDPAEQCEPRPLAPAVGVATTCVRPRYLPRPRDEREDNVADDQGLEDPNRERSLHVSTLVDSALRLARPAPASGAAAGGSTSARAPGAPTPRRHRPSCASSSRAGRPPRGSPARDRGTAGGCVPRR